MGEHTGKGSAKDGGHIGKHRRKVGEERIKIERTEETQDLGKRASRLFGWGNKKKK